VKPYRFHREADAEFTAALRYYTEASAAIGARFYDEVERAVNDARKHPRRFREIDPPVRRCLLRVFPHAVLYIDEPDRIWVIAVCPLRREPRYWRQRLVD
jgi:toxin ParE1/3/4